MATYVDAFPPSYYRLQPHPVADQQQQAFPQPQPELTQPASWWTDGVTYGATGYDDSNTGVYTYSEEGFLLQ